MSQFDAIEKPIGDESGKVRRDFFISGGTLPADSPSYIERAADQVLFGSLSRGRYCYVLNSRQMGKSSLSVHTIGRLEQAGIRTAFVDLTRLGGKNVTVEQWYTGIAVEMARELNLRPEMTRYWKEHANEGPMLRLFGLIREVFLAAGEAELAKPLVIFFDEIDATRTLSFDADEFFSAIRESYNRRVFDPVFAKLTFCLLGVAVPSDLIRNPATTPFNIGERVYVEDFKLAELRAFATQLGKNGSAVIERVHFWTGGHPFLSQSLCRMLARMPGTLDPESVDEVVSREFFDFKARDSNVNLADVSNIALHYGDAESDPLKFRADLLSVYHAIWGGKYVKDDESNRVAALLKLSGIARSEGRRLYVRNRIYRHVFDLKWIDENMPGQELRRQKHSYRRGVRRTAVIAGAILTVVGLLGITAWNSRLAAVAAKKELDYELYVADINTLHSYYDNGDTARIEEILARHKKSPYRGFEWGFWQSRFHDAHEEYTLDYIAPGKRELGKISADGKEICLIDTLTGTATIIDRASKRATSSIHVGHNDGFGQAGRSWVQFLLNGPGLLITDLKTGHENRNLIDRGYYQSSLFHPDFSNFAVTAEESASAATKPRLGIWDVGKGIILPPLMTPGSVAAFMSISRSGDLVSYACQNLDANGKPIYKVVQYDRTSGQVFDQFETPVGSDLLCRFDKSRLIIYRTPGRELYIRDGTAHTSRLMPPLALGIPDRLIPTIDEHSIVSLYSTGHCVVCDFPTGAHAKIHNNASDTAIGAVPGQILASATSVKLYHLSEYTSPQVVADGLRVTRFSDGKLNVFAKFLTGIHRIDEVNYSEAGDIPMVNAARDFTYNGRWTVTTSEGHHNLFEDAKHIYPPVRLPGDPSIWSCGLEPFHVAVWDQNHLELSLVNAVTGELKWRHTHYGGVLAIWVSPDGTRLFVVRERTLVQVYETETGRLLRTISAHNIGPIYVTFSRHSDRFFTCGGDGRVVLWDMKSLRKIMEFRGNALKGVTCADISSDGRRVVTSSQSGWWQLWDSSNGVQLLDIEASKQPLSAALFCEDGNRIITAGDDDQVRVWISSDFNPTIHIPVDRTWLSEVHE